MDQLLINAGLSEHQAKAYLYLLEHGPSAPKELTKKMDITRTNAYKVLESLEVLGLVYKEVSGKKLIYRPADPSALASLLAEKRNNIIALEQKVNEAMVGLRQKYSKSGSAAITSFTGKQAMVDAYENQSQKGNPIYFIKSRADIPFMGYDTMSNIRIRQASNVVKRYGITPDSTEAKLSTNLNLERTWIKESDYTSPVEWSTSDGELIIQVFDGEGYVISIDNSLIAESFRQIWNIANQALTHDPDYINMPRKAKQSDG
ncbi:MAG TPA: helix-turn-helix domain-containing protein [Candidatus Sulfotelmatobacter sp.]|nr:helix-turn-helix domain-containing protein [Candidatus Sulfotelmatobacter sp.]